MNLRGLDVADGQNPHGFNAISFDPSYAAAQFEIAADIVFSGQTLPVFLESQRLRRFLPSIAGLMKRKGRSVDIGRCIISNSRVGVLNHVLS